MQDEILKSFNLPARWTIRVGTRSGESAQLRIAIGFDHTLETIETTTPFEYEFVARQYTALMSLIDTTEEITAEEWSDLYGEYRKTGGGSGGLAHKFLFNPLGPTYSISSSVF